MVLSDSTPRSGRPERGFTLLEVLTAFVLFALTLAALLQIFSSGLRDAQLADEFARASALAQSQLAGYSAAEKMDEGSSQGEQGPFSWELKSTPYDERQEQGDGSGQSEMPLRVRLLRVESVVSWLAADGRRRDVRLVTLQLVPKP